MEKFNKLKKLVSKKSSSMNFHQVTNNIFRSARLTKNELQNVKDKHNIRTVINLEDDPAAIKAEQEAAKSLGLKFISKPLSNKTQPSDKTIDDILKELTNSENFPILVHCHAGRERTGLIVGFYRVLVEGKDPDAAYQEMLDKGFRPQATVLDDYFKAKV